MQMLEPLLSTYENCSNGKWSNGALYNPIFPKKEDISWAPTTCSQDLVRLDGSLHFPGEEEQVDRDGWGSILTQVCLTLKSVHFCFHTQAISLQYHS